MAQSKDNKVIEQLHANLKNSCFKIAIEFKEVLKCNELSNDAHSVYVDLLVEIFRAYSTMTMCHGLYVHSELVDTISYKTGLLGLEYRRIDYVINSVDKLEGKYKNPLLDKSLEDLKADFISMQEYDGTWEALYTTEEPPF